jgi:hypothetical protein
MEATETRTDAELNRLFHVYRLCNLNVRYYGCRAEKFCNKSRYLNIGVALLSAGALAILLGSSSDCARFAAAAAAGLAAVGAAIAPLLGWSEKAGECQNLRFSYAQLFNLAELVIAEIRRGGEATEEQIGAARIVHEAYMRIDALDELEPDQEMIDKENAKVLKAYPDDYIWTHF